MSPDRESFIDLASPTFSPMAAEFSFNSKPLAAQSMLTEQSIPPSASYSHRSHRGQSSSRSSSPQRSNASKPVLPRLVAPAGPEKPPVPTAPKPDFSYRSRSGNRLSPQTKKASPLHHFASDLDPALPTFSTANALTPQERAAGIRTTRKLAQVFGQPPGVPGASPVSPASAQELEVGNGCMPIPGPLALNLSAKRRQQHRPAASMSDDATPVHEPVVSAGGSVWPPPDGTRYLSLAPRRHSAPLSPDDLSFLSSSRRQSTDSSSTASRAAHPDTHPDTDASSVIDIGPAQGGDSASSAKSRRKRTGAGPGSPMSFIDLSDEEAGNDSVSEVLVETPKASRGRHPFSSTASIADSVSSEQLAEEERRRKREKLAKLHRFLGSRVPPHLVLGPLEEGTPLPPPAFSPDDDESDIRKVKMRRRRSSSAAEFSRTWSDDIDRLKEELNEREKAINVRRAVKMEKVRA